VHPLIEPAPSGTYPGGPETVTLRQPFPTASVPVLRAVWLRPDAGDVRRLEGDSRARGKSTQPKSESEMPHPQGGSARDPAGDPSPGSRRYMEP